MFPETTSAVLNALADASVRALLVVGIAVVAAWRRPAAFRHAVFAGALCVMLLLPLATVLLPELPLTVLPPGPALTDVGVVTVEAPAAVSPAKVEQASSSVSSWPAIAVILWWAMAAAFGLRVVSGIYMARRAVRGASPIWNERFSSLPSGCGVYESDVARVPLTVGSSIILPAGWRNWDCARLAAVLAHEGAHVRRRDWLLTVLAALNRCVFWFHPLAWWLERRIAVDAEHAADDASLIATGDRRAYAELLLEMARNAVGGRLAWQGLAMARPSGVSRRIDAALDDRRKLSAGVSRASALAVVVAGVALLVVTGTARLVAQEPATVRGGSNAVFFTGAGPNILDPETAAGVEQELLAKPEDTNARLRLITYYNSRNRDTGRLMTHIFWFVEHQPEARVNPAFAILLSHSPDISPLQIQEFLGKWDAAVASHPEHSGVLINAAEVWRQRSPHRAADLLIEARGKNPQPNRASLVLASLYTSAIINDKPAGFAQRARTELEKSDDPELVGAAAGMLNSMRARPNELGLFAARVVERARQLVPGIELPEPDAPRGVVGGTPGGAVGGVPQGADQTIQRIKVGANVQESQLLERVDPVYPPLALQARAQGIVRFNAVIAPDGTVANLQLTSGHPLLVEAARDAVKRWRYRTTLLNGSPVEVVTTIDVPFKLPDGTGIVGGVAGGIPGGVVGGVMGGVQGGVPQAADQPVQRIKVGANVQESQLVERVDPVYPPLAVQARVQGIVRFNAVIAADGTVANLQMTSGHPLLVEAARDAVKRWRYRTTLLNGSPVEVVTIIDVPFKLPE